MNAERTVVCATDLSPESASAVAAAAVMSRLLGANLELFHALSVPSSMAPDLIGDEVLTDLRASAESAAAGQAAQARRVGANVQTCIQLGGPDAIADRARQIGAEMLVVGTHARKGAAHFLLGSVAERTLRAAPCPTLVVPPGAGGALTGAAVPPRLKIVGGIDFSPASDAALAWLGAARQKIDCDVRLVHLYAPAAEHERMGLEPPMPFEVNAELVAALSRDLRPRVQAATGTDFALRIRPLWGGEDDPLAWEAETDDADLLIIGTSQARRSTALRTVRGAHLPVLCVPRAETAAPAEPLNPIQTVLVPTDFSGSAAAVVAAAYRLLLPGGGDIVLANVAEPDEVGLEPSRQEEIETCLLGLVPANVDPARVHVRTLVVADRAPGEAIVKAIRRVGADLVVMAGRSQTGKRGGHGMVTDHVIWNASCPVAVVPAASAR
jgi:nucleotide-binding universal stress UspA family protein